MTEGSIKTDSMQKLEENKQISRYLPGFYQKNIPWWPFVLFSAITAIAIGTTTNIELGISPSYIPAAIIAIFISLIILQKPEVGAYILIVSVFTSISDILTDRGLPAINRPLIAITIGSVLINYLLKTGRYNRFPILTRAEWALIGYYTAIIISAIIIPDKSSAFDTILDITKDILVGVSIYITLNTQERWKSGVTTVIITVAILAAMGVYKTATGSEITFFDLARTSLFGQVDSADELRYGGPIGEPNLWGQVLVSVMPFVIYSIRQKHSPKTIVLLGAAGFLILLAMIYTSSRGAMVAFLIISPLIAMDMKIKPAYFLTGALLLIALFSILPDSYQERFKGLNIFGSQDELLEDGSISSRRTTMQVGLEMFRANPIFGVGFGKYRDHYWEYAERLGLESGASNIIDANEEAQHAHSLYIEVAAETGFTGLFAFTIFFSVLFSSLYGIRKKIRGIALYKEWMTWVTAITISVLTFLISGIFLHGVFIRYIWVLIGLAMAAISISDSITPIPFIRQRRQ